LLADPLTNESAGAAQYLPLFQDAYRNCPECAFLGGGNNMVADQGVIVLQEGNVGRSTFVEALTACGFAVRSCGSLLDFSHLYTTQPTYIVILISFPPTLEAHVAKVREMTPFAAIIALGQNLSVAWRIRIMQAGADSCYSIGIDMRELSAILAVWRRRVSVAMKIKRVPS
jgi:DNA-binding response OmpR family regulator